MKKIILWAALLIAVFIPTYLAIYNYSLFTSDVLTKENTSSVRIIASDGSEMTHEGRDVVKFYVDAVTGAKELIKTGRPIEFETPIRVLFKKLNKEVEYKFYLSRDPSDCIFIAPDDTIWMLDEAAAKALLSTDISDSLYSISSLPAARIVVNDTPSTILPSEYQWLLKKQADAYTPTSLVSKTAKSNPVTVYSTGSVSFEFDTQPDYLSVTVLKGAEIIFDGLFEDFLAFDYGKDAALTYELTAQWNENADRDYAGSGKYILDVKYDKPAVYNLSSESVTPGQVVVLTAENVNSGEEITLSTDMGFQTKFIKSGDKIAALLPVGLDAAGKSIALTISSSDNPTPTVYNLTVGAAPSGKKNFSTSDEMIDSRFSDAAVAETKSAFDSVLLMPYGDRQWEGSFVIPNASEVAAGFGYNVTINMGHDHIIQGMEISLSAGSPIYASNAGKVIYAQALTEKGNVVVIDHGMGIKSWYCHLEAIGVNVGDTVTKGQEIGQGGKTGFITNIGYHLYFAVSVGNTFVDPQFIINTGFPSLEQAKGEEDVSDEVEDLEGELGIQDTTDAPPAQ
ncbi:MAG: M23 family metallopeptidase [Eubacteriales bacterium]